MCHHVIYSEVNLESSETQSNWTGLGQKPCHKFDTGKPYTNDSRTTRTTSTATTSNNNKLINHKQVEEEEEGKLMETQRIFFNPSNLGLRSFNRQTSFYKAIKAFDPEFSHIATQGGSQGIDGHGTIDT